MREIAVVTARDQTDQSRVPNARRVLYVISLVFQRVDKAIGPHARIIALI